MVKFESKKIDEKTLDDLQLTYAQTSKGFVHYQLNGPENGDLIVLVHGFSTPSFIWDNNFDYLVSKGFRVLRYDLYGRGYSARPKCKYNSELYENQLLDLLKFLKLDKRKFTIAGLSMGGGIAIIFTSHHLDIIKQLILFDPIGFPQVIDFSKKLLSKPIIGSLIFKLIGNKVLISGLNKNFKHYEKFPDLSDRFAKQMEYKGFQRAIVSTYQNMPFYGLETIYNEVGKTKVPVLLFWAIEDQVIPFSCSEKARHALPNVEFHALEDTGHNSNYESADLVNPIILKFLTLHK